MGETKSKKTKSRIIEAGIQILTQNPTASIEEIATSIGLSRRTLHRYFKGKSDLLEEITQYACLVCLQSTKDCISSSDHPTQQLKGMFYSDIKSGIKFQFLYSSYTSSLGMEEMSQEYQEMMTLFREVLAKLIADGWLRTELTIKWVENFYIATINAAITTITTDGFTEDEISEVAWRSFITGVAQHDQTEKNND